MSRCLRAPPLLSAAACARGARCGRGVRTAAAARGDTGPVRYGLVRHLAAQVGLGAAEPRELLVGREHRAAELALHDGVEERVHERRQRGRLLLGGHEGDLDGAQACRRAGGGVSGAWTHGDVHGVLRTSACAWSRTCTRAREE